jgi:hypothetical protein
LSAIFTFWCAPAAQSKDIVIVNKRHSDKDTRSIYPYAVLTEALRVSEEKYGEFEMKVADHLLPNNRTIDMLVQGEVLNVVMVVTTKEWEKKTIPIRIPLRRGALAYRLLAINKINEDKFRLISNVSELKRFTVGLHRNWATWDIMNHLGFKVGSGYSYESLFGMLSKGRFDYLPRGAHEIYDELAIRKWDYPNLVPAPNIALYIPSPFYMFVSPKHPKLAKRLTWALERMVKDGTLKSMFDQYYKESLLKAELKKRTILNLGNPLLPEKTPLDRKELWIDLADY